MRRWLLTAAITLSALGLGACRNGQGLPFLLGGIQVNEADVQRWLDGLEDAGMNAVAVTDYAHQGDWDSANLWHDEDATGVLAEIRAARARGLHAVLVLRVALDHAFPRNEFLWHGMIQPAADGDLDEWFRRYTEFVVDWAEVAEREGVKVLFLGSELSSLTSTRPLAELPVLHRWYLDDAGRAAHRDALLAHEAQIAPWHLAARGGSPYPDLAGYLDAQIAAERAWAQATAPSLESMDQRRQRLEEHWRALIARVRQVFSGLLGYAANFDQYQEVTFWRELDVMGINAYFQLRRELLPERTEQALYPHLLAGWRQVLAELQGFRREQRLATQPVLFTEMGFTFRANSTLEPWAADGFSLLPVAGGGAAPPRRELVLWPEQPVDRQERALAVRVLREVLVEQPVPFLSGVLYWKLSTEPAHREVEPFVLILGGEEADPLTSQLRALVPAGRGLPAAG